MTQALQTRPDDAPRPFLLTLEDFETLYVEISRFAGRRFELIRGEVLEMSSMGDDHYGYINTLGRELTFKLFAVAMVGIQTPVRASKVASRPEPDFTLRKLEGWTPQVPDASEVLAVVEVSDTTLQTDRTVKLEDYAREGVPEYWIINLKALTLEVYTQPEGETYKEKHTYAKGEVSHFTAFPAIPIEWWTFPRDFEVEEI